METIHLTISDKKAWSWLEPGLMAGGSESLQDETGPSTVLPRAENALIEAFMGWDDDDDEDEDGFEEDPWDDEDEDEDDEDDDDYDDEDEDDEDDDDEDD